MGFTRNDILCYWRGEGTVFSESEVVSLISKGEDRRRIALGLHESVANRVVSMVKKVGIEEGIVFAGGVAKSACLHHLLEKKLGRTIRIPEEPQVLGALGAAFKARDA
jgi:activator of 2-hydroxyglutaryl-CoA dehydratase